MRINKTLLFLFFGFVVCISSILFLVQLRDVVVLNALNHTYYELDREYSDCIEAAKANDWAKFILIFDKQTKSVLSKYKFFGDGNYDRTRLHLMKMFTQYYMNFYELQRRGVVKVVKEKTKFKIKLLVDVSELLS